MRKCRTPNIANSIWYKEASQISPSFEQTIKSDYDAEIRPLDFSAGATKEINAWIEGKTNNKIEDMHQTSC